MQTIFSMKETPSGNLEVAPQKNTAQLWRLKAPPKFGYEGNAGSLLA